MKSAMLAVALAALLQATSAHYRFSQLAFDGQTTPDYAYVRKNTNINSPLQDPSSTDMRCNTGATAAAKTATVAAGATVGMNVGYGDTVVHPGPLMVYLSKAPAGKTASTYDGSGDWFKIFQEGTSVINSTGMFWETTGKVNFTWTLPANTPPGDYLMRTEHIGLHQAQQAGGAQYYMECAQLTITGGDASASPSPVAKIPSSEIYSKTDPGVMINIYYPIPQSYTPPGPAVWGSGAGGSSSSAPAPVASSAAVSSAAPSASSSAPHVAASSAASSAAPVAATSAAPACAAPVAGSSVKPSAVTHTKTGTEAAPAPTAMPTTHGNAADASGTQSMYGQCGGIDYKGATACGAGAGCKSWNPYYFQCLAGASTAAAAAPAESSAAAAAPSAKPEQTSVAASAAPHSAPTTMATVASAGTGEAPAPTSTASASASAAPAAASAKSCKKKRISRKH